MTREEIIEAISDDKTMPFVQPEQLSGIVDFVIKNYHPGLDDVIMDFARELDFFLYGSYTPERFPNSMQVRDERSGLRVNDWKCWVNRPEYKIAMVEHFFTLGKQAGAAWMAGQGVSMQITDETEWADVDSFVHKNLTGETIIQIRKK